MREIGQETLDAMGITNEYIKKVTPWYDILTERADSEPMKAFHVPKDYLRGVLLLLYVNDLIDRDIEVPGARAVAILKVPRGSDVENVTVQEDDYEILLTRVVSLYPSIQCDPYNDEIYSAATMYYMSYPCVVALKGSKAELDFTVTHPGERGGQKRIYLKSRLEISYSSAISHAIHHKDFPSSGLTVGDIRVAAHTYTDLMVVTSCTRRSNNNRRYVRPVREPSLKALLFLLKIFGKTDSTDDISKFPRVLYHGKGAYSLRTLLSVEGLQYHSLPYSIDQAFKEKVKRLPSALTPHYTTMSTMLEDGTVHHFETIPWKTTIYKFDLATLYAEGKQSLRERYTKYDN